MKGIEKHSKEAGAAGPFIRVKVLRSGGGNGGAGYFAEYDVPAAAPLSVMALLAKVHDMDGSFACRTSMCFKGHCGSCLVRVNGQDVRGCVTLVQPGETVTVEPHSGFRVIRDLVVDFSAPAGAGDSGAGGGGETK